MPGLSAAASASDDDCDVLLLSADADADAKSANNELPSRVAQWYYKHGLFLSSYPTCAVSIAVFVILMSCYPLLNIPMPGTTPTRIVVPHTGDGDVSAASESAADWFVRHHESTQTPVEHQPPIPGRHMFNFSFDTPPFPWARTEPFVYVQQVVLRTQVVPWPTDDMQLTDAFRAPLHEVFRLLEVVSNHEHGPEQTTLARLCLHVENVKRRDKAAVFPEYNCLVLSPANLWQQSAHTFNRDASLLSTIFQHHNIQKSKVSTAEMLFGMQLRDTGIKRYPIRVRPRIVQFAVTLVLRHNDQAFLGSLREKLTRMYPLHQPDNAAGRPADDHDGSDAGSAQQPLAGQPQQQPTSIMYVYYPGEFNWLEFTPLALSFVMLFAYVYFSIRKIDEIRSRAVLAICAVITVFSSLMMSLGLCFFFDLTTRMQSKGVFQYLIILLGLENVLVITKSVTSTDHTFDVKIRVAQGLSREGWTISKTLLTEITILTIGLATFVPVIQEFCVFAIVGLISDFFLQMMLFSTVLAMDIRRVDVSDMRRYAPNTADNHNRRMPLRTSTITPSMTINRTRSHPKLSGPDGGSLRLRIGGDGLSNGAALAGSAAGPANGNARLANGRAALRSNGAAGGAPCAEIPKRLRIVNFWARTRFFQRAFMLWMIVWIGSIIYNARVLEQLFVLDAADANQTADGGPIAPMPEFVNALLQHNDSSSEPAVALPDSAPPLPDTVAGASVTGRPATAGSAADDRGPFNVTEQMLRLRHPEYDTHYYLSNFHWSAILRQYNVSLSGRYVAVLPPIKLSYAVPVAEAHRLRNVDERPVLPFQWKALAVALDPIDFSDHLDGGFEADTGNAPGPSSGQAALGQLSGGAALLQRRPPPLHGSTPLIPKSPMEIFMVAILCAISVSVLAYTMMVFYRCICTRNYAEWRSSWNDTDRIPAHRQHQRILEGVPIQVCGHTHRIECLVTDGQVVASSCLDGQVKLWDTNNGEQVASIDRNRYFPLAQPKRRSDSDATTSAHPTLSAQRSLDASPLASGPASPERPGARCLWSPIWCLDYLDNLIAIGCSDGRMEFWEASSGTLKCVYALEPPGQTKAGVTHVHLAGNRVVLTRLSGRVDFLRLESYTQGRHIDWGFTAAYRRTHVRAGSTGSMVHTGTLPQSPVGGPASPQQFSVSPTEELRCVLEQQQQGHQQPITCMHVVGNSVFTGSQDHTLKVFALDSCQLLYTLHGHCGPITCLFIDHYQSDTGGSGSQDGLLCVWELLTGACMYSIQAHDGAIVSLACAPSYVISVGADERLCVWERFQGNLLNTINVTHIYTSLLMLTPSLLVTGKPGSLIVWDVRTGEPTREVKLDCANMQQCPKLLLPASGSVICDYGSELRIVRFPLVADKSD